MAPSRLELLPVEILENGIAQHLSPSELTTLMQSRALRWRLEPVLFKSTERRVLGWSCETLRTAAKQAIFNTGQKPHEAIDAIFDDTNDSPENRLLRVAVTDISALNAVLKVAFANDTAPDDKIYALKAFDSLFKNGARLDISQIAGHEDYHVLRTRDPWNRKWYPNRKHRDLMRMRKHRMNQVVSLMDRIFSRADWDFIMTFCEKGLLSQAKSAIVGDCEDWHRGQYGIKGGTRHFTRLATTLLKRNPPLEIVGFLNEVGLSGFREKNQQWSEWHGRRKYPDFACPILLLIAANIGAKHMFDFVLSDTTRPYPATHNIHHNIGLHMENQPVFAAVRSMAHHPHGRDMVNTCLTNGASLDEKAVVYSTLKKGGQLFTPLLTLLDSLDFPDDNESSPETVSDPSSSRILTDI